MEDFLVALSFLLLQCFIFLDIDHSFFAIILILMELGNLALIKKNSTRAADTFGQKKIQKILKIDQVTSV